MNRGDFQIMIGESARLLADDHPVWDELGEELRAAGVAAVEEWGRDEAPAKAARKARKAKAPPVSRDTAEAVDATATEDVIAAVRGGSTTAVAIASDASLPVTAVSRILTKLVRAGKVQKTGTRRGCRYALPGQEKQPSLGLGL